MKITDFVPSASNGTKACTINITVKGYISLTQETCRLLDLVSEDEIVISFDEDHPKDWFIRKGNANVGRKIIVKQHSAEIKVLTATCSSLTHEIFSKLVITTKKSLRLPISREPIEQNGVKYYPIITAGAK